MKLLNKVMKDNNIFGFTVKDGDLQYSISKASLHNPLIHSELLKSGWNLVTLPYDFRQGSLSLDDLPSVDYYSQNYTDMDLQEMEDMELDKMTETQLRATMVTEAKYLNIPPTKITINTREELLEMLLSIEKGTIPSNSPMVFLPLNYIVDQNALFSAREYINPENSKWTKIIEERRNISLYNMYLLQMYFIENLGLNKDFNAKEFIDFYFQWGICGIRYEVIDKRVVPSTFVLDDNTRVKEAREMFINDIGYLDSLNKVMGPNNEMTWTCYNGEASQMYQLKILWDEIKTHGNMVLPMSIKKPITTMNTQWTGDTDISYEMNETSILISVGSNLKLIPTIRLTDNVLLKNHVHIKYWNLVSGKGLIDELIIRRLCDLVTNNLTIKSNASSYKALLRQGCSPVSVFKYIANNMSLAVEDPTAEDGIAILGTRETTTLVNQYMRGLLLETDAMYTPVSDYITSVVEGEKNVDNIAIAVSQENENHQERLYETLVVANRYLGFSIEEIIEKVEKIDKENRLLEFERNDLRVVYEVPIRDFRDKAFSLDLVSYGVRQSQQVNGIIRVTEVYREMAPTGYNQRHVAVRFDMIRLVNSSKTKGILKPNSNFEKLWKEAIQSIWSYAEIHFNDQSAIKKIKTRAPILLMKSVFEIVATGKMDVFKSKGLPPIVIDTDLVEFLRSNYSTNNSESLFGLCSSAVNSEGKFWWHCVNATITPIWVIPNPGITLMEYPFKTVWLNKKGRNPETLATWFDKGWIPSVEDMGLEPYYNNDTRPHLISHSNEILGLDMSGNKLMSRETPSFLLSKYHSMMDKRREDHVKDLEKTPDKLFHIKDLPMFEEYSKLADLYPSEQSCDESSLRTVASYSMGKKREITHETILKESPMVRQIMDSTENITIKHKVLPGVYYDFSCLREVKGLIDLPVFYKFPADVIKAVVIKDRTHIIFMNPTTKDMTIIHVSDLPNHLDDGLALHRIDENHILIEDIYGRRYTAIYV